MLKIILFSSKFDIYISAVNIIIYKLFMHNNDENVKPSFEKTTNMFFSKTFLVIHYYYYYYYYYYYQHFYSSLI